MPRISVAGLDVEVIQKEIKHLHLGVYPPDGRVRVSAPLWVDDETVRLAVIARLGWIKRHQEAFLRQERQSARECVYRESHYFLGRRYLLKISEGEGPSRVVVQNKTTLNLFVPVGADSAKREQVLNAWYRRELKALIPPMITQWAAVIGVQVTYWGVKKMKTKWGSCNPNTRRIWLNLELAKTPVQCLDYIIVHELVHLLERKHNDRFRSLMDTFMPQWRLHRDELNRVPLGHEHWCY